jgi:hypothetical protein
MDGRAKFAMVAHAIPTTGLLLQGLLYVSTARFMPYHADALGTAWEGLPANYQGFLIGVIKAMGAGSIGVSMALVILLLIPFRNGDWWARWAVPLIGAVFTALTAYAAFTIDARTPASPPWRETIALTTPYLAGALISYWPSRWDSRRTAVFRG